MMSPRISPVVTVSIGNILIITAPASYNNSNIKDIYKDILTGKTSSVFLFKGNFVGWK